MAETLIQQINPIDRDGNILLHGREGLNVVVSFKDADGELLDISARDLFFEIRGAVRKALEEGDSPTERKIVLSLEDLEGVSLGGRGVLFELRDETGEVPDVLWEGSVILRGFKGTP